MALTPLSAMLQVVRVLHSSLGGSLTLQSVPQGEQTDWLAPVYRAGPTPGLLGTDFLAFARHVRPAVGGQAARA
jgi:hypothetical protein